MDLVPAMPADSRLAYERLDLDGERWRALDVLASGKRFLLCGHVRSDGDCFGAQSALTGVLERFGREVRIVNTDPLPPSLEFLGRDTQFRVYDGGELPAHDVCVMFDFCEIERTGSMKDALQRADSRKIIV